MYSPLEKIKLKELLHEPIMFDANIFMVGIENRLSDPNCTFDNIKELFLIPIFESFKDIFIHEKVYEELDGDTKNFVDTYIGNNVSVVSEESLYGTDPLYTTIFNDISMHERVQYTRGASKDKGEVYSLAYASYYGINYFSSKEIMVDDISKDLHILQGVEIITFDVIVLLSYIYHVVQRRDSSKNKALKSQYKKQCEDVIRRHGLPKTLAEYVQASLNYI